MLVIVLVDMETSMQDNLETRLLKVGPMLADNLKLFSSTGNAVHCDVEITQTISVIGTKGETYGELHQAVSTVMPSDSFIVGGQEKCVAGEPIMMGDGRVHEESRPSRVVVKISQKVR